MKSPCVSDHACFFAADSVKTVQWAEVDAKIRHCEEKTSTRAGFRKTSRPNEFQMDPPPSICSKWPISTEVAIDATVLHV